MSVKGERGNVLSIVPYEKAFYLKIMFRSGLNLLLFDAAHWQDKETAAIHTCMNSLGILFLYISSPTREFTSHGFVCGGGTTILYGVHCCRKKN